MTEQPAFSCINYYIMVTVSAVNPDRCGICVDTVKPTSRILVKMNDTDPYIIHRIYTFMAPKKSTYAAIINNLRNCKIEPVSGFISQVNPDNKYYLNIHIGYFDKIVTVIEKTLSGLCLGPDIEPLWDLEIMTSDELQIARAEAESRIINLEITQVVIMNVGAKDPFITHKFPQKMEPILGD